MNPSARSFSATASVEVAASGTTKRSVEVLSVGGGVASLPGVVVLVDGVVGAEGGGVDDEAVGDGVVPGCSLEGSCTIGASGAVS